MRNKIKFGTDGWRAIIGEDFNLRNVEAVAQAVADYLKRTTRNERRPTKVAVGYDRRRLSLQAARQISMVLAANGIKVILSDQALPTQVVSYVVRARKLTAGIMVTASHNPPQFNGIKIKSAFGGSAKIEVTNRIERLAFKRRPLKISIDRAKQKGLLKVVDLASDYLRFLRSYLDMQLLKKRGLKVLADPMHGTADSFVAKALKDTPSRVTTIRARHDFSFGGNKPEPIEPCVKKTALLIKKNHFDIGLVNDGDADRIAALDGRGRFVNPQQIVSLLLLHLLRYRRLKGAIVKTISGTSLLDKIAKKYHLKIYETPIGFKHISELMQKKNILIGGEEGGGIGVKDYIPERDGILCGLLLVECMIARNMSLAGLLKDMEDEFGSFVYLRKDLRCPAEKKKLVRVRLADLSKKRSFAGIRVDKVKDYDGLKFYLADGSWILFRLSGTEPLLRIYAEAENRAKTKSLIANGKEILKLGC
ncbi:MAG: phosphoglucomutase/phosphomannomutase family protein [Candidatus Omnitrophica bacterium]|nr:phosphoglucomutase/phosphomannomutase family protein [Candidatus Omnitrophota bacterium]